MPGRWSRRPSWMGTGDIPAAGSRAGPGAWPERSSRPPPAGPMTSGRSTSPETVPSAQVDPPARPPRSASRRARRGARSRSARRPGNAAARGRAATRCRRPGRRRRPMRAESEAGGAKVACVVRLTSSTASSRVSSRPGAAARARRLRVSIRPPRCRARSRTAARGVRGARRRQPPSDDRPSGRGAHPRWPRASLGASGTRSRGDVASISSAATAQVASPPPVEGSHVGRQPRSAGEVAIEDADQLEYVSPSQTSRLKVPSAS